MLVGAGIAAWWWAQRPALSEKKVQQAVVATLQREAPSSFLVTGKLQTTVISTITNDKIFLPDMLDLNVGTTETTARVPGTIHYGFDVGALRAENIRVGPGDTVTVTLPELSLHSVEPNLRRMQVRTESGWTRNYDDSRSRTREAALRVAQDALRDQGRKHLQDSRQPRYNTARAMEAMLTPVLKAAGARDPVLRFRREGEGSAPRIQEPVG
jgi:translation initiation factor IF-1